MRAEWWVVTLSLLQLSQAIVNYRTQKQLNELQRKVHEHYFKFIQMFRDIK